jgi:hypothetical protein
MYQSIPALAFLPPDDGGSPPPAFTPRGLWFTRVIWWPIVMAGGSTFLAGCTALIYR